MFSDGSIVLLPPEYSQRVKQKSIYSTGLKIYRFLSKIKQERQFCRDKCVSFLFFMCSQENQVPQSVFLFYFPRVIPPLETAVLKWNLKLQPRSRHSKNAHHKEEKLRT